LVCRALFSIPLKSLGKYQQVADTPSAILSVADNHGHHHIGLKAPVAQAFLLIIVLPSFTVMRPEPAMKHGLKHGLDRNRGRTMKRSLHRLPAAHLRRLPDANL
jgi:hypothetical protein